MTAALGSCSLPVCELDSVSVRYPNSGQAAIRGVSLVIHAGETILLGGRSGSGKSTLAAVIAGVIPGISEAGFSGGHRQWGQALTHADGFTAIGRIAMVFQDPDAQLIHLRVEDELCFGLINLGHSPDEAKRIALATLSELGAEHLWEAETRTLSGGQKQTIALAAGLAMAPELLVLDEPTAALDMATARQLANLLRALRKRQPTLTVVIVEHNTDLYVGWIGRLVLLDGGRVVYNGLLEAAAEEAMGQPAAAWWPQSLVCANQIAATWPGRVWRGETMMNVDRLIDALIAEGFQHRGKEELAPVSTAAGVPAVALVDVSFDWSDQALLRGVSLSLYPAEIVCLLGRNGTGKTTLLHMLAGLIAPQDGHVMLDGKVLTGPQTRKLSAAAALLMQTVEDNFLELSVGLELAAAAHAAGIDADEKARIERQFALTELRDRHTLDLSPGEMRRLAIALQAMRRPQYYLFDEPTLGLDRPAIAELHRYLGNLRDAGAAILLVTHDLRMLADVVDRCMILTEGRIVFDGALAEIQASAELLSLSGMDRDVHAEIAARLSAGKMPRTLPITSAELAAGLFRMAPCQP